MKKNILLLTGAVLITLSSAFAGNVSVQDAQTVAVNFFKITLGNSAPHTITATLKYTRTEADNTVDMYAFDMSPLGFVIISATDNDEPIIGYSTESYFPSDFSKIGLTELLSRWGQELHYVKVNNIIATPKAAPHWAALRQGVAPVSEKTTSVAPLCQTTWDQLNEYGTGPDLYNNYCPGTNGNKAVTGCVATAMAQIMKYWSYPTHGTGSSSYPDNTSNGYSSNYGTLSCNYADSTFLWSTMPATLSYNSSAAAINAIGTIMKCAGVSVDMDYATTGSGAYVMGGQPSAQYSYVHFFGYQNVIKSIGLSGTNASDASVSISSALFIDSIEAELNASRLVQMEGSDVSQGGHTWVCDGYNTSNQIHMNWGWSGSANGYYTVTNLSPTGQNINFTTDIGVLIHILPPNTAFITESMLITPGAICAGTSTQLSASTHTGATYSWTPTTGLSSSTIANPVATPTATTTYTITADSAGIYATSSVTVTVNPKPAATISTSTAPTCYGTSNGSVTVLVSSGTSGYSYLWSNGQATATATGLAQGTYSVTVTDSKSCTATATQTITQPTALSASGTPSNATCGQANGSIATSVSGGTSGYTYHWSNSETTATATTLAAGTYNVTITDAHSCSTTISATITGSGTLTLATTAANATCYGSASGSANASVTGNTGSVSYHWSTGATTASIQNLAAATYVVTITDGSGCSATSSKTVSQPTALSATVNVVDAGCGTSTNGSATAAVSGGTGSYTYHWSNGANTAVNSNIASGTYTLSVTDANSCSATFSAVVASGSSLSASVTSANATCYGSNNGTGHITLNNGTSPYAYSWSNGATSVSVNNLAPGSYSVTISDANHCTTQGSISVTQPNQIQVTTNSTSANGSQADGSATVANISGATAPYQYFWSTGSTAQTITDIATGTYGVTVTDANGCSQTATDVVGDKAATAISAVSNDLTFSLYPNPARTQVFVQFDQAGNAATTLSVRNILGQTIISQLISVSQTELDLNALANGVYLVELRHGEKSAVKQLVITR